MNDFELLARQLEELPSKLVRQGRGMTAKKVNAAARSAQRKALATWTAYGRGMEGSAGTIRARMSRDDSTIVGYVMADGPGAFFQENGSGHRPPKPVLQPAVESQFDSWKRELLKIAADL